MSTPETYLTRKAEVATALQQKLRLRAAPFDRLVAKAKPRLPRRVWRNAVAMAEAEQFVDHPRLSRTLDFAALDQSADLVLAHLKAIDLADERKGRILSILGAVSFSLIAVVCLLVLVLVWRGYL